MLIIRGWKIFWESCLIDIPRALMGWVEKDSNEIYFAFQNYIEALMHYDRYIPDPPNFISGWLLYLGEGDLDRAFELMNFFREREDTNQEIYFLFEQLLKKCGYYKNHLKERGILSILGKSFNFLLKRLILKTYEEESQYVLQDIEEEYEPFPNIIRTDLISIRRIKKDLPPLYWHMVYFRYLGFSQYDFERLWHINNRNINKYERKIWDSLKKTPLNN